MLDLNKIALHIQIGKLTEDELFEMYDAGYLNNSEIDEIIEIINETFENPISEGVLGWFTKRATKEAIKDAVEAESKAAAKTAITNTAKEGGTKKLFLDRVNDILQNNPITTKFIKNTGKAAALGGAATAGYMATEDPK